MTDWHIRTSTAASAPQLISEVLLSALCVIFIGCAVWLSLIDIREHRLPNRILYPWAAVTAGLLLLTALLGGEPGVFGRSMLAGGAWSGGLALTRLIRPPPVGAGDVKLAAVLGMYAGYAGWTVLCGAVLLSFLFGGAVSAGLMLARRVSRGDRLPFGPFLLAGTACALALR